MSQIHRSTESQSSDWPPRPVPDEEDVIALIRAGDDEKSDHTRDCESLLGRAVHAGRQILERVEGDWLGLVEAPLARRMDESRWSPDVPDMYCDRCGSSVGYGEANEFGCGSCRGARMSWERVIRLGSYTSPLDEWVQAVKFRRCHRLGEELGGLLGQALIRAGVRERADALGGRIVVVPVATSYWRRMERKIDHTLAIARGVGRELGSPVRCLLRKRARRSQRAVAYSERESNVRGAFRLRRGIRWSRGEGRVLVLVDDVTTSGATLRLCARLLRRLEGVESVWCGVLGVTVDHDRGETMEQGAI